MGKWLLEVHLMTEADWLAGNDPESMLDAVRDQDSDRKLRLFAVACCRSFWEHLSEEGRGIVELAERHADGQATGADLAQARQRATSILAGLEVNFEEKNRRYRSVESKYDCYDWARELVDDASQVAANANHQLSQWSAIFAATAPDARQAAATVGGPVSVRCACLCELFGNPFRPVAIAQSWLTPTAVNLGQAIYDDRAFDRMPILADALEDAGCTSQEMLAHCRGQGPHVRGCWVVDLILAKSQSSEPSS
jgi:hypothetical protein